MEQLTCFVSCRFEELDEKGLPRWTAPFSPFGRLSARQPASNSAWIGTVFNWRRLRVVVALWLVFEPI
jgi:hypothetical protein